MKSSNVLSADLASPSKVAAAASSSKSASVTNNTVTESSSVDKSTEKSTQADRFSSEYEAAVKGDKKPLIKMMKKSSNDENITNNQTVGIEAQPNETHALEVKGSKEISLDSENTAASDVESKQQVMTDGEAFLNQLSVSNKQLATASEQDGKLLPPQQRLEEGEQGVTSQLNCPKSDSHVEGELPASVTLTQNATLQQKNNPSTTKEQMVETQDSSGLSDDELAKVFASSSANIDSQKNDTPVLSSENGLDKSDVASVPSPDNGQLAMAGVLAMPSNEQAKSTVKNTSPSVEANVTSAIPWSTSPSVASASSGAAAALVASPTEAVASTLASHSAMGAGMGIAGAAAAITDTDNTDGTQSKEINSASANSGLATGIDSALTNTTANTDNKTNDFSQQLSSLSGQQSGLNTQVKSEALAQAQSPLQLSKEQAGDQVSERINMMLSKNLKHVDIRLDPPELGKLQIRLSLNQDQASVQFTVGNQQTRDLVEHSMPRLREMLHQQGLQLAQNSVYQDASRQAFSGQSGQQNQNGSGAQQSGNHSGNGAQAGADNHDDNFMSGGETVDMYVKPADDSVDYYA